MSFCILEEDILMVISYNRVFVFLINVYSTTCFSLEISWGERLRIWVFLFFALVFVTALFHSNIFICIKLCLYCVLTESTKTLKEFLLFPTLIQEWDRRVTPLGFLLSLLKSNQVFLGIMKSFSFYNLRNLSVCILVLGHCKVEVVLMTVNFFLNLWGCCLFVFDHFLE